MSTTYLPHHARITGAVSTSVSSSRSRLVDGVAALDGFPAAAPAATCGAGVDGAALAALGEA